MSSAVQIGIFGRMALAALLGFAIGFEREYRGKPRVRGVLCGAAVYLAATLSTALVLVILEAENIPGLRFVRRLGQAERDPPTPSP